MEYQQECAIVGLGKMGANLALQAQSKGIKVVGYSLSGIPQNLLEAGVVALNAITDIPQHLKSPRIIFLYIPAGPTVDNTLEILATILEAGDIIVDGGNSYWGDSIRRHDYLQEKYKIHWIDLGTSGGVSGARNGACFMAGGDEIAVKRIEPILLKLAVKEGYTYTGSSGSGHFTKLVHNGIEFGMLQAIGEGINLLKNYPENLDIQKILKCWRNGSVIRSWLIDLMEQAYIEEGGLENVPSYVDDTGEVNWLVSDAIQMEVAVPVISQAIMQLFISRDDKKYWARAIAMMRNQFGGHPYGGPHASLQEERRLGQVGKFFRKKK